MYYYLWTISYCLLRTWLSVVFQGYLYIWFSLTTIGGNLKSYAPLLNVHSLCLSRLELSQSGFNLKTRQRGAMGTKGLIWVFSKFSTFFRTQTTTQSTTKSTTQPGSTESTTTTTRPAGDTFCGSNLHADNAQICGALDWHCEVNFISIYALAPCFF